MSILREFYKSTIGKKIAMAASGLVLVGFVIAHMLGNLKIFFPLDPAVGEYKIDHYGRLLRTMGSDFVGHGTILWIARIVLLGAVFVHAVSGIQLSMLNKCAKPTGNHNPTYGSSNAASRTMLFGGLFLALFIVFHILHFTTGNVHPAFAEGRVYQNVFVGFQNPLVAAFYVVAMGFLMLHLYHGTWSMFQTLGVTSPRWNNGIRTAAKIIAIVLFVGFSAVPASVVFGKLPPPHYEAGAK